MFGCQPKLLGRERRSLKLGIGFRQRRHGKAGSDAGASTKVLIIEPRFGVEFEVLRIIIIFRSV